MNSPTLAPSANANIEKPGSDKHLARRFADVRALSVENCQSLTTEDFGLQAVAETSPPKWHLAHTTWFFETFLLKPFVAGYESENSLYEVLFNSYYNGIGQQHPRHQRGLLSRPSVEEVMTYRAMIDEQLLALLGNSNHPQYGEILSRVELGINHEQQHQELFFTDLKYSFFQNPLFPAYCQTPLAGSNQSLSPLSWQNFTGGLCSIGHNDNGFSFDNELPAHNVFLQPFQVANRLITNGEYLDFIADGGYQQAQWWLSDAWSTINQLQWRGPLYWIQRDDQWFEFTLHGLALLDLCRPVVHVSAYEADAFARWRDARLATEFELEIAIQEWGIDESCHKVHLHKEKEFHPGHVGNDSQLNGATWQWTSSAYGAYPGYKPAEGAIGEYNGKFMCNQLVLRGSSCATSRDHSRTSYRNFFYPKDRWQFSGIRLAQSV